MHFLQTKWFGIFTVRFPYVHRCLTNHLKSSENTGEKSSTEMFESIKAKLEDKLTHVNNWTLRDNLKGSPYQRGPRFSWVNTVSLTLCQQKNLGTDNITGLLKGFLKKKSSKKCLAKNSKKVFLSFFFNPVSVTCSHQLTLYC